MRRHLSDVFGGSVLLYVSTAGQLSCSVTRYSLEISLCWIHEFISNCVHQVAAMEKISFTVFGALTLLAETLFSHFPMQNKNTPKKTINRVPAVADNWLLLLETRWTMLSNSQCQACMKEEWGGGEMKRFIKQVEG